MHCFVEFVTVPTVDTPGTILLLHFNHKRYLIGQFSEGCTRAFYQRKVSLRKVSHLLLTGRTEWANIGGLLGVTLTLADTQKAAVDSARENRNAKESKIGKQQSDASKSKAEEEESPHLKFDGPSRLNHAVAVCRRFIFRTGVPLSIQEHRHTSTHITRDVSRPTWSDESIKVWALPITPSTGHGRYCSPTSGDTRKRPFSEVNEDVNISSSKSSSIGTFNYNPDESEDEALRTDKEIVEAMFTSDWRMDKLHTQRLRDVHMPAAIFIKDPTTNKLLQYTGPKPGGAEPVPDIEVFVRKPWPGSQFNSLPTITQRRESVSYIVRNHPQRGRFLPKKALELGVEKGPTFGKLAAGQSVKNKSGDTITPDMVLEPTKPGSGFMVLDVPGVEYVDALLSRSEWDNPAVMEGVGLAIWLLGPGVAGNDRLRSFQQRFSGLEHVISSVDVCPDLFALESAVDSAWMHNFLGPGIFPKLLLQESRNSCALVTDSESKSPVVRVAKRGLRYVLEPNWNVETKGIVPPLCIANLENSIEETYSSFGASARQVTDGVSANDTFDWESKIPSSDAEIITLGTGSGHPSTHRNVSGILVRVPNCGSYLFDCGEGTLGTLKRLYSPPELQALFRDLKMIWISHMHADHHLGLTSVIREWYHTVHLKSPNLEDNASNNNSVSHDTGKLGIVSDKHMLNWLEEYAAVEDFGFSKILPLATTVVKNALNPEQAIPAELWRCQLNVPRSESSPEPTATFLDHMALRDFASVFVNHCRGAQAVSVTFNTGLKVSYSGDCRPSAEFAAVGRGSHILIHEATLDDDMRAEAIAKKHSTAGEALIVASKMEAAACVLTHFSQRYPTVPSIASKVPGDEPVTQMDGLDAVLERAENTSHQEGPGEETSEDAEAEQARHDTTKPIVTTRDARELGDDYNRLIGTGDISKLVSTMGVRVVSAFDYMRLKIRDIPTLQRLQPILRDIYEKIPGKSDEESILDEVPADSHGKPKGLIQNQGKKT